MGGHVLHEPDVDRVRAGCGGPLVDEHPGDADQDREHRDQRDDDPTGRASAAGARIQDLVIDRVGIDGSGIDGSGIDRARTRVVGAEHPDRDRVRGQVVGHRPRVAST